MPITDTLKTAEDLRQAGFNDTQANVLAQKFEETAQAQNQDLKSFIHGEFEAFEGRINIRFAEIDVRFAEIDAKIESIRADLQAALRDQMLKFITINVALITLAVAVIKLFPNLP